MSALALPNTTPAAEERMIVAACAAGGAIRIEIRRRPEPGPGELRLRLRCAGLCGTDLFKLRYGTAEPGTVLGHEVVGTVEAVGDGAAGFDLGDRVVVPHHVACGVCALCRRGSETLCPVFRESLLVPGGFSESVLVRERAVRRATFGLPGHVPDEAAVFLEPAACVLRGIRHARLEETAAAAGPATVALLGAGSMGLLHLLVLAALPSLAVRIVVSDPLEERRRLALLLGAAAAEPPGEGMRRAVAEASQAAWGPTWSSTRPAAPDRSPTRWRSPERVGPPFSSPMRPRARRPGRPASISIPSSSPSGSWSPPTRARSPSSARSTGCW